jgi:L-lactate utilization protein LutB
VLGVAHLHASRISDSAEGVRQLGGLAEHARRYVAQKAQETEQKLLNKVKSLTAEELRVLPRMGVVPQGGADVARKPRP